MYAGLIFKSQHVEDLKPKCVIKENYMPPRSKFSAIFSFMLREMVPNLILSLGTMPIEVVKKLLVSTGVPVFSDTAKQGWKEGYGESW